MAPSAFRALYQKVGLRTVCRTSRTLFDLDSAGPTRAKRIGSLRLTNKGITTVGLKAKILLCTLLLATGVSSLRAPAAETSQNHPWPAAVARAWYNKQPWLLGVNYIPSTAINTTEMWQKDTFDPKTIDKELKAAADVGFNCVRVFMQYLVWKQDPEGLKQRMAVFMQIAARHHIRVLWVLFDDCAFDVNLPNPFLGPQPSVVPGYYANGWTPSPGPSCVSDQNCWPSLKQYVEELIITFRSDPRVLAWDIYNEPAPSSVPLLGAAFEWAREAKPSQPITSGGTWIPKDIELNRVLTKNSDVITFHNYGKPDAMTREIVRLAQKGRPLICTEWMARQLGSTPANILPVLYGRHIGAFSWGLVNGKTQTNYHTGSKAGDPAPAIWQHDLFHGDMSPYDQNEIALFKHYARKE
jgi:hypothetical protein